jgi:hypothetical protein
MRASPRLRRGLIALLSVTAMALSVAAPAGAQDSKGSDFWLAFQGNFQGGSQLTLFIAGDTATAGTVTIPGLGFTTPFTVTPGAVTSVNLPTSAQQFSSDAVENLGIHVTSVAEVTVYGLNRLQFTTDAYLGLPTDALGTDYINLGYKNSNVVNGSQFGLVAAQDATTVTITPSVTTGPRAAGVPYTVNLNQGQTYMLRNSDAAPADLSGTLISSNKPIGVYGGHNCANIPPGAVACDHIVEQLTPTTAWGKNFVSMPLATRNNGDTFRIMASQDNTTVQLNGTTIATLNRAQFDERLVVGPAQITADKPILVMQYSNGTSFDNVTSDPFEMMIPPFEQFLAGYTISTPGSGFSGNYVNVVAPNAAVGAVLLDGAPIPAASYTPIGSSGFSGAQVSVGLGSHTLSGPLPFGVHSYGFDQADSYGYPGGLSLSEIARVTNVSLTPETATNPIGTQHCVTATVTDQNGNPLKDVRVDFGVTGPNATSGFAFTNASGQAQFCYTGANTGTDTIKSTVGTLSDTATKTWTAVAPTDTTKPSCALSGTGTDAQGRKYIEVTARDTGSGLKSFQSTKVVNGTVVVPPFTQGTTSPVVARTTKINQSASTTVEFQAIDMAGNTVVCDPVITIVTRDESKPVTQTFSDIPAAEHLVRVYNGNPGVMKLDVTVNGRVWKIKKLSPGEEQVIDVAGAMHAGSDNIVAVTAQGKAGGTAMVVISDS